MKKNKVFVNKINKKIGNNQKDYNINELNSNSKVINDNLQNDLNNDLTVKEKLDKLLNRNGYVFNVDVRIITYNKEYNTRIAGMVNNHLITLDNDIINVSDIKDIIINN